MIVLLIRILFVISLTFFSISVFLVFCLKKRKKAHCFVYTTDYQKGYDTINENTDFEQFYQRTKQSIALKYPQIPIMFEDISKDACLMLQFKGLCQKKESVIYILRNKESINVFLSSVEQLIEDAKTPKYGIVIVLPYTSTCNKEILENIQKRKIPVSFLYTDESQMMQFPSISSTAALLARGRKPYVIFEVKNDNENYDWLGELNCVKLFQPAFSENVACSVKAIKDLLSKDVQIAFLLYPFFKKLVMEEVMDVFPQSCNWFLPVIDKQETKLVIYAQDEEQLEQACETIKQSAKKANITLKQMEKDIHTYEMDIDSTDFKTIQKIIKSTLPVDHVIPVLLENSNGYPADVPVLSFAPIVQNTLPSFAKGKDFYLQLFQLRERRNY